MRWKEWVGKVDLSPSLVISVIALFVALGGGAYAALGPNSVGPTQLKPGAVTAKALRDGSVKQRKLAAGSVGSRQIKDRSVTAAKLRGNVPGTLVAYALIGADGNVVPEQSMGIDSENVSHMPIANTCLRGLPEFRTAMVTPARRGHGGHGDATITVLDLTPIRDSNCWLVDEEAITVTTYVGGSTLAHLDYSPFYIYLFS